MSDLSENSWTDEEEMLCVSEFCCLFCSENCSLKYFLRHLLEIHMINLPKLVTDWDSLQFIRFVNFIRTKKIDAGSLPELINGNFLSSLGDEWLKPHDVDDSLLTVDLEEIVEQNYLLSSNDEPSLNSVEKLKNDIYDTPKEVLRLRNELQEANDQILDMKKTVGRLLGGDDVVEQRLPSNDADHDEVYSSSYSHFSIHQEMLQDEIRTHSYQKALSGDLKGKVVLDVGCGTGILSMMAARSGATVIGVDMSDIIIQAMDIVRENKLESVVTLIKGKLEEVKLPVSSVDMIVSEWMGYFLLFESMLDTVLYARDKWLKSDGIMMPNFCQIMLCASDDLDIFRKNVDYWSDVWGFKMNCMRQFVISDASVAVIRKESVATDSVVVKEIDCYKCQKEDLQFSSSFVLTPSRSTKLAALVGYFDVKFEQSEQQIFFSTGPHSQTTHWKQTVFLLKNPLKVEKDIAIEGSMELKKLPSDARGLEITFAIGSTSQTYIMQ